MNTTTSRGRHRSAVALLALLTAAGGVTLTGTAAEAATHYGTAKVKTQRMSSATLKSTQHGWYSKGSKLKLSCYKRGQSVQGYYSPYVGNGGWDDLWYKVSDGYYVADIDINTGSNKPVTGACSTSSASSLSKAVDSFVNKYNGKYVDYDGAYGYQCVDLFNFYNRDVVKARFASVSYAYQLYDIHDTSKYTKVAASSTPKKGDVAIWASNYPSSGGGGHVAIVLSTSGSSFTALSQNPGATTKKTFTKSYLRGFLRPKG